jgi:hypothetical protein
MRSKLTSAVIAVITLVSCCGSLFAQSTNATLSGVVHDPQGAVIPNAAVNATEIETGQAHQTTSGGSGAYTLPNLPIGDYKVVVSAPGFSSEVIPSITLHVNQAASLDFALQLGEVSEHVVVTAELPLLNSESSSVGAGHRKQLNREPASQWPRVLAISCAGSGSELHTGWRDDGHRWQFDPRRPGCRANQRYEPGVQRLVAGWRRHNRIRAGRH